MKCKSCGQDVAENERFCSYCGQTNDAYINPMKAEEAPPVNNPGVNPNPYAGNTGNNPYQQNPYGNYPPQQPNGNYPPQQPPPYGYYPPVQQPVSSVYAILALIFGALGGWFGLLFGIIGLTKYKGPEYSGKRVMCVIGIVLWAVWFVIQILLL